MQASPKGSRQVLSRCAMGELKHKVKQSEAIQEGFERASKVQNLTS